MSIAKDSLSIEFKNVQDEGGFDAPNEKAFFIKKGNKHVSSGFIQVHMHCGFMMVDVSYCQGDWDNVIDGWSKNLVELDAFGFSDRIIWYYRHHIES